MKSNNHRFRMLSSIVLCLCMVMIAGCLSSASKPEAASLSSPQSESAVNPRSEPTMPKPPLTSQVNSNRLYKVVQQAQISISNEYDGLAKEIALQDLMKIVASTLPEDVKIKMIRERFLKPSDVVAEAVDITEGNATAELIDMSSLKWRIHSMEVIWRIDSSEDIVLSDATVEKVVDVIDETDTEAKDKKRNTHVGVDGKADAWISASKGKKEESDSKDKKGADGSESKQSWWKGIFDFSVKGGLNASMGVAGSSSWDSSSSELWSRRSQETLTKGYDRLAKRIRSAKVSDCRLNFSISFENNGDKDLVFDADKAEALVYENTSEKAQNMLSATPVKRGIQRIPKGQVKTFVFEGPLDNSKSLRLLDIMRKGIPDVRIWEGQFTIESTDHAVTDAIDDARKIRTAPVICVLGDELRCWNIKLEHGGKPVTIKQALWAVNGIYERSPFTFDKGECVSVMGCATTGKGCTFSRYPVLRLNGKYLSGRLTKTQLEQRLDADGVSFHIVDFTDKESRDQVLYGDSIQMFIKEAERLANDGDAPAQFFLGLMYYDGKGVPQDNNKAIEWWNKAAEQGNAKAQFCLGFMYCNGHGVPQDYKVAVEWYTKAAEQGGAYAQYCLGFMYSNGHGVPQDYKIAVEWYTKAAEQGDAEAQRNLGIMYYKGEGVQQSYEEALKWFKKAAGQNDSVGQKNLGVMYYFGRGVPQDYKEAGKWFTKAAEQGDANAQCNLGIMYYNGDGVPQDYKEAFRWYTKAAEQGSAMAQFNLGVMYGNGQGVPQDYKEAFRWYTKAAEQGYAMAQYNLGVMYGNGRGVPQDYTEAFRWYTKAAEQGYAMAQYNLYIMYFYGKGVPQSRSEAVKWCRRAAELGYALAQYKLGFMYDNGDEVPRSRYEAVMWYKKAAAQGNEDAKKRLKKLGE